MVEHFDFNLVFILSLKNCVEGIFNNFVSTENTCCVMGLHEG